MPELPEVETVKNGLKKLLPGKVFKSVLFDYPKGFPNTKPDLDNFLISSKVVDVRRRAKVLIIDLSSDYSLVIHLKMTGQMVYRAQSSGGDDFGSGHPNDSLVGKLPDRSTRVEFTFTDGSKLFFNDQRKFGWVRLVPTIEIQNIPFFQKVGPEPLEDEFTIQVLFERMQRRKNSMVKVVLLDQSVLAGIGNIYADEALFMSGIHPETRVINISKPKIASLHHNIRQVLQVSIDAGGSTDKNYVDAEGKKGSYLTFAKVFRREGLPCKKCGKDIIKTRVAGRGTHICTTCQPVPKVNKKIVKAL